MNKQRPDILGQAIIFIVTTNVRQFRFLHRLVFVGLGLSLIGVVVCMDILNWFPRWPVYALTVLLVFDALLHARLNRTFAESEVQKWRQVLALADTLQHKARVQAAIRTDPPKPKKDRQYDGPSLRAFRPDEESPKGS